MTRDQALGQRFLQILDRIFPVQVAERRRDGERARAQPVDRMALRTVGSGQLYSALNRGLCLRPGVEREGRERKQRRGRQCEGSQRRLVP